MSLFKDTCAACGYSFHGDVCSKCLLDEVSLLRISFRCLYWAQNLNAKEVYTTELYQEVPSDQKFITVVYDKYKQGFDSWDDLREWEDNRQKSRRRR